MLATAGVACLLPAATATAAGKHTVLAPREGQTLSAGTVNVRVRAGNGTVISARLNGRPAGDRFDRARHAVRSVRLSPSHGVRFGKNVLRVRIRQHGKRRGGELHTVHFRINADGPLAAAGHDRKITLPGTVVLDGAASLSHLDAAHRRQHLRYSWRVVRAPRHSRLVSKHKRKRRAHSASTVPLIARAADDSGLDDTDAPTTSFSPDQPGTYTFDLTVTAPDGQSDTDRLRDTLVMPPYVEVETMAHFVPPPVTSTGPPPTQPPTGTDTTTSTTTTGTDTTTSTSSTTSTSDQTSTTLTTDETPTTPTTDQSTTTAPAAPPPDQTLGAGSLPPPGSCQLRAAAAANGSIDPGTPGVRIGDLFCPGDPTKWLQVVVLDRKTLMPKAFDDQSNGNKNYPCPAATVAGGAHLGDLGKVSDCINTVKSDLADLNSTSLVIAVSQPPDAGLPDPSSSAWNTQPSIGVAEALSSIGVTVPSWSNTGSPFLRGRFSAIGVPTYAGAARVNARPNLEDQRYNGDIVGHLITDNNLNYTFRPPHVSFNTQDVGSSLGQNVVRVGGRTYTAPISLDPNQNGKGGFQVVVLEQATLGLDGSGKSYWFPTGEQNFDSGEAARLNAMAGVLRTANAGSNLVIITSRGNPSIQGGRDDRQEEVNDSAKALVDQIEALGGTRIRAYQALGSPQAAKSGSPYTLIGWSGAGVAQGFEAQGPAALSDKAALTTAPVSGFFEPGNDYFYKLGATSVSPLPVNQGTVQPMSDSEPVPAEKLQEVLDQPSQRWPDNQTANEPAAISYIEDQLFVHAGHDIRTDYTNSTIQDTTWQDRRTAIKGMTFPSTGSPPFNQADFNAAQTELVQEITWLLNARAFTKNLAQPLTDSGLTAWSKSDGIAASIDGLLAPPASNHALLITSKIFEGLAEAAIATVALVPGVGEAVAAGAEVASIVYQSTMELISTVAAQGKAAQPGDEPFAVTAAQARGTLQQTMVDTQDMITKQYTRAIASDYGRLKLVGQCSVTTDKGCTENPDAWQFSDAAQVAAKNELSVGAQIETYAALLPAKYNLYQLGDQCSGSVNRTCWETDFQGDGFYAQAFLGHVCPFLSVPGSAKLIRPLRRDIPNYRNPAYFIGGADTWQAYALGKLRGLGVAGNWFAIDAPGDYLNGTSGLQGLFAPIDPSGDLSHGGLGANREEFFMRAFSGDHAPILVTSKANGGQQQFPLPESFPLWGGRDPNCINGVDQSKPGE